MTYGTGSRYVVHETTKPEGTDPQAETLHGRGLPELRSTWLAAVRPLLECDAWQHLHGEAAATTSATAQGLPVSGEVETELVMSFAGSRVRIVGPAVHDGTIRIDGAAGSQAAGRQLWPWATCFAACSCREAVRAGDFSRLAAKGLVAQRLAAGSDLNN